MDLRLVVLLPEIERWVRHHVSSTRDRSRGLTSGIVPIGGEPPVPSIDRVCCEAHAVPQVLLVQTSSAPLVANELALTHDEPVTK